VVSRAAGTIEERSFVAKGAPLDDGQKRRRELRIRFRHRQLFSAASVAGESEALRLAAQGEAAEI
jgi:hypothetical protein